MSDIARYKSKAEWVSKNPVLRSGEPGFEDDTGRLKIGDGVKRWNELSYKEGVRYTLPSPEHAFGANEKTLDLRYARNDVSSHEAVKAEVKRSRAGRVGLGGKPAVAIRIDHGVDQFLSTLWPLMKVRNIPGGLGVMSRPIGNPNDVYEPTSTTWAQLLAAHKDGFEVWSHSMTHRDPAVAGTSIYEEIVQSKLDIEARGFRVQGFQMPGISGAPTPHYSPNWDPNTSWKSEVGQLLLANYGLIQVNGAIGGARRILPTDGCYDLGHYTLDGMDWSATKNLLDSAIARGFSTEWMVHPRFVVGGTVAHTVAHFTSFLDYLVQLRDSGVIEILTPSGLAFADPDTSRRFNLLQEASFEGVSSITTSTTPWTLGGAALPVTIGTDGGRSGSKYLHIPASAGYSYVQQGTSVENIGINGATMMVEAWVRCTGSNTEASIVVVDSAAPSNLNVLRYRTVTAGAGWQRHWNIFTVPKNTKAISIRLARRVGSGDVSFDDVVVTPI